MINRYFSAEKVVDKQKEGEYITKKYHVKKVYTTILPLLEDYCQDHLDDPEIAYSHGVSWGFDDLYSIEAESLLEYLEERFEEEKTDYDEGDYWWSEMQDMIKFLQEWKGYDLYFREEENDQ